MRSCGVCVHAVVVVVVAQLWFVSVRRKGREEGGVRVRAGRRQPWLGLSARLESCAQPLSVCACALPQLHICLPPAQPAVRHANATCPRRAGARAVCAVPGAPAGGGPAPAGGPALRPDQEAQRGAGGGLNHGNMAHGASFMALHLHAAPAACLRSPAEQRLPSGAAARRRNCWLTLHRRVPAWRACQHSLSGLLGALLATRPPRPRPPRAALHDCRRLCDAGAAHRPGSCHAGAGAAPAGAGEVPGFPAAAGASPVAPCRPSQQLPGCPHGFPRGFARIAR